MGDFAKEAFMPQEAIDLITELTLSLKEKHGTERQEVHKMIDTAIKGIIKTETAKARSSVGDLAKKHAERADYFKPDTMVVMVDTLDWASKLPESAELKSGLQGAPAQTKK